MMLPELVVLFAVVGGFGVAGFGVWFSFDDGWNGGVWA